MRTIPNIAEQLKPLEEILSNEFIPTLFGSNISANERQLLTFPVKYGGLGLRIWHEQAEEAHAISKHITTPLQNQIKAQCTDLPTSDDVAKFQPVVCFPNYLCVLSERIYLELH